MIADWLAGVRVLDLSQYLPGPYAAQILADLGADVVKVEPPAGEPGRTMAPVGDDGIGHSYKLNNRGKRRIVLDLKSADGKAAFGRLVAAADVLLESFRPGVIDRLGFGAGPALGLNPQLVFCSLSGFGQTGPLRDAAGHDLNYMALAGGMATQGSAVGGPVLISPPVADRAGGMTAATAILAALVRRGRHRKGAVIDVGITDAVLAWHQGLLTEVKTGAVVDRQRMMTNGATAYYNIYRTADGGYVTLGPIEAKFWKNFCDAVDRPDWTARQHEPVPQTALIAEVQALFASRSRAEWEAVLGPADCCFMPVLSHAEIARHPHFASRGTLVHDGPFDEVPFPALAEGAGQGARPDLVETTAAAVLEGWR